MKSVAVVLSILAASCAGAAESSIEEVRTLGERYQEVHLSGTADRLQGVADGQEKRNRFVSLDRSFLACRDTLTRYDEAHGDVAAEARYRKIMQEHAEETEQQARRVESDRPELAQHLRRQALLSAREFGLHQESHNSAKRALEKVQSEWETTRSDCLRILAELEAMVAAVK